MNKHRLSIKNSGRRSSENMAGACGQIDFLVLISFPPWSSEWDSQGSHFTHQLWAGWCATLYTGSSEQRHSRPQKVSLALPAASTPAGRSRARPCMCGEGGAGREADLSPASRSVHWGAATTLLSPRGGMKSCGNSNPLSHQLRKSFFSFAEEGVRRKCKEKPNVFSCQSSLLEKRGPRNSKTFIATVYIPFFPGNVDLWASICHQNIFENILHFFFLL